MKLALLSDLHSNLEALTACLAHARAEGADAHAFLGDLVGYGADPGPVLELVREHVARGAVVVRGNHDAAAASGETRTMDPAAAEAIHWTRGRLAADDLAWLGALPLVERRGEVLFVHASADAPEAWIYVVDPVSAARSIAASRATFTFSGHVHQPALWYTGAAGRPLPFTPVPGVPIPVAPHRRWLGIPGSAGQPRDGSAAACYAILDVDAARLTYHRVPYDVAAAAGKILAAGLPERLARRLERGE